MRRKIPSTASLVAFEAAARHQSFTRAAEELALTQGAVCRQVATLEAFLGQQLFNRTRRGVLLTDAGLDYSRKVALQLDAVERDTLAAMGPRASQSLELAVMPTFATQWLLPKLKEFQRLHPEITVHLTNRTRPFLFAEPLIDAMIYFGDGQWPGCEAHFLMSERQLPVCSPELLRGRSALSADQLASVPLLHHNTRRSAWRQWFSARGVNIAHDREGPRYDMFCMLAQAAVLGMGVALIPPFMIRRELAERRLVVANSAGLDVPDEAYYLMVPAHKSQSAPLRLFSDWLVQSAQHDVAAVSTPSLELGAIFLTS